MSKSLSIPHVTTKPHPFGVTVRWQWPESRDCYQIELQYLLEDGVFQKEIINWPDNERKINGLKAGERLQVRLRPINADGSWPAWRTSDWIECASSTNVPEIIESIEHSRKKAGWSISGPGKVFINDAIIKGSINVNDGKTVYNARIGVGIENKNTKVSLSDEMKSAIIDAVLESKQFVENKVANAESLKVGQVTFLADRFKVSGDAMSIIENAVLSDLLVNVLSKDHCPVDGLEAKAIKLAKAVQAAFNALVQEDATAN
ncbi:hypothetical protein [Enterobacter hormaechei]|uniref:hypothetical protein n=1 Tax=Enterobacter hormaechei TaxID=158836 RepID=UPI00254F2D6F|nr:hypothetical protein [Enterobacter hormaechei]MEC5805303.1 hypothetical protein [Enterobacter hormaechei]